MTNENSTVRFLSCGRGRLDSTLFVFRFMLMAIAAVLALSAAFAGAASAQLRRPNETRPTPPTPIEDDGAGSVLPPIVLPSQPDLEGLLGDLRFVLRDVEFDGNTAVSDEDLAAIAAPFEGRAVSFNDLQELQDELTKIYIGRGYLTSGAWLPDQSLEDGVVRFEIVEGVIDDVVIETDGRLRDWSIRVRLREALTGPVNVRTTEEQLLILKQDERVADVGAELQPTDRRGHSILKINVVENAPYEVRLAGNNYRAASIGPWAGVVQAKHNNVSGFSDTFSVQFTGTEGLQFVDLGYRFPISPWMTTLSFNFQQSFSEVVEEPFDNLEIEGDSQSYGFTIEQPIVRSLRTRFDVFLTGERRRAESRLLGQGFSFVLGPDNGVSKVAVLRLGQVFTYSGREQAFAVRSTLSFGLPILGATSKRDVEELAAAAGDPIPDGEFFAWLLQAQYARRLPGALELVMRFDAQLSDDPLLGLEQFAVGGHSTVRGYRENLFVRDNGMIGSTELRIPILSGTARWPSIRLAPFVDVGYSWNRERAEIGPSTLVSIGLATGLEFGRHVRLDVSWGHELKRVPRESEWNLQDSGLQVQLEVRWP